MGVRAVRWVARSFRGGRVIVLLRSGPCLRLDLRRVQEVIVFQARADMLGLGAALQVGPVLWADRVV